jgi:glycosyltransferase involved in cell wall biosynthesis
MISVVIPTSNSAATLATTLEALVPAAVAGLVREVIIVDAGSADATLRIAESSGADVIALGVAATRSAALISGAQKARFSWLLFLNADTELDASFIRETDQFIARIESGRTQPSAAVFQFALDDASASTRLVETLVQCSLWLGGPASADHGLLVPRALYTEVGGFRPVPVLEDVDLAARIGRRRIAKLRTRAIHPATLRGAEGYLSRALRRQGCLALYRLNVPLHRIARLAARAAPPAAAALK